MAFEQEEEDFEFGSVFQDDDDDEEYYEEPAEFRDYSEDEIEGKWGNFSFEDLVFELENILSTAKKYFFSKKKRVVDAEETVNLTKLITKKFPSEITKANEIIDEEQQIISDAKRNASVIKADADAYHSRKIQEADANAAKMIATAKSRAEQIIADAKAKAEQMVEDHTITQQARAAGAEIIDKAKQESRNIVEGTKANCQNYISDIVEWAEGNINGVNDYVFGLLGSAREAYVSGVKSIDSVKGKYKNDYEAQVSSLKKPPRMGKTNNGQ
ncbi:MAG: hypothetical protein ACI4W6_02385 [Acutalibacteraceae bacterium]